VQTPDQQQEILQHYTTEQLSAALRVFTLAQRHDTGGGHACARLLLSLYNGRRFPLDPRELSRLDDGNLEAAYTVLRMDVRGRWTEIHNVLDAIRPHGANTQHDIERWAFDLGLPGHATCAQLRAMSKAGALEVPA